MREETGITNEVECAVLSSLIDTEEWYFKYADHLSEDLFTTDTAKKVFKGISEARSNKEYVDDLLIQLMQEVTEQVVEWEGCHHEVQFFEYVSRLNDLRDRREIHENFQLASKMLKHGKKVPEVWSFVLNSCAHITERQPDLEDTQSIVKSLMDRVQRVKHGETAGLPTGLIKLDQLLGGWQPRFMVLAGRPAMGKTGCEISHIRALIKAGHTVVLNNLEMTNEELIARFFAQEFGVDLTEYTLGKIELEALDAQITKLMPYLENLIILNIFNLEEFRMKLLALHRSRDVQAVFIDYLQLMRTSDRDNDETRVSKISTAMKRISLSLNIPIVALAQLNRSVEQRGGDKIPQQSDLRGSGQLEQDADCIIFVYRPEYYGFKETASGESTSGLIQYIVAKHRNGAVGSLNFEWVASTTAIKDKNSYFTQSASDFDDTRKPYKDDNDTDENGPDVPF